MTTLEFLTQSKLMPQYECTVTFDTNSAPIGVDNLAVQSAYHIKSPISMDPYSIAIEPSRVLVANG